MPKGPRKLVITFGNQTLTHYGGVYLLHRFLTRIGLKNAIATEIRFIQRNNRYTVGELLLAILYPIILVSNASRQHNRPRLAMPAGGTREIAWKHALRKIEKLRL